MSKQLEGKVSAIAGVCSGIDLACARLFVSEGIEVAIIDQRIAEFLRGKCRVSRRAPVLLEAILARKPQCAAMPRQ